MSFTRAQEDAIGELVDLWKGRRFVLIGAVALGCHLPMTWRRTNDIDLVISADLEAFPAGLDRREEWTRDRHLEQRWVNHGTLVDIILSRYPADDERSFDDSVFEAGIEFEHVNAFLCGRDVGAIAAVEHLSVNVSFLQQMRDGEIHFSRLLRFGSDRSAEWLTQRLAAFRKGLEGSRA